MSGDTDVWKLHWLKSWGAALDRLGNVTHSGRMSGVRTPADVLAAWEACRLAERAAFWDAAEYLPKWRDN